MSGECGRLTNEGPFQTLLSTLKEHFWDVRCLVFVFKMQLYIYLMGGRPYGCLYHNSHNDDYTEVCIIMFYELHHTWHISTETGEGNVRMIKTDSYFSSHLIDNFCDSSYGLNHLHCSNISRSILITKSRIIKLYLMQVFVGASVILATNCMLPYD